MKKILIKKAKQNCIVVFETATGRAAIIASDVGNVRDPAWRPIGHICVAVPPAIYNESIKDGHDPHKLVIDYARLRFESHLAKMFGSIAA
jgi:hypothetical protein